MERRCGFSASTLGANAFLIVFIVMKILFLSRWFPNPTNNGSKLRISNLLWGLSKHHKITLLSFTDPSEPSPNMSALTEICSEVYTLPWREYDPQSRRARFGLLSPQPRFLLDTHSVQMETQIRRLLSKNKYDLVIASQLNMASYYGAFGNVQAIFEEIELGSFHDRAYFTPNRIRRLWHLLTWLKLKVYFSHILKSFTAYTVASEEERAIFTHTFPEYAKKLVIIPNCIDMRQYQNASTDRKPHHLIFSGSFKYGPNYQAMLWFIGKVFPLILEQIPDAQLLITGDHADLPLPPSKNVHCTGHVQDIKSLIASCEVSIAPLWSGGGTRLKILEAMALGTPVVATSKGAEGLLAKNGEHILIADEPEKFARSIISILKNAELSDQLSSAARQLVQEHYNWPVIMPKFLKLVEKAATGS